MNVLDPFEVADIEVWPLWELQQKKSGDAASKAVLRITHPLIFRSGCHDRGAKGGPWTALWSHPCVAAPLW